MSHKRKGAYVAHVRVIKDMYEEAITNASMMDRKKKKKKSHNNRSASNLNFKLLYAFVVDVLIDNGAHDS